MNAYIGNVLRELLEKEGAPSMKDFASMMGMSTKTLYNMIKGESTLSFEQVLKASQILNYDIGKAYSDYVGINIEHGVEEPASIYRKIPSPKISVQLSIAGTPNSYQNFSEFLMYLKEKGREYGFEIV